MPQLKDFPILLKEAKPYKRKHLRPWDNISELKPTSEVMPPAEGVEKTAPHLEDNREIIGKELDAKLVNDEPNRAYVTEAIKRLCGQQKKLLFYIVENCKFRNLLHTDSVTNETLRRLLNTDKDSVKTTVHRLTKKKVVGRKEGKRGRGGFYVFTISRAVMEALMESGEESSVRKPLDNDEGTISKPLLSTSTSTNTNPGVKDEFLLPEWKSINPEPLQEIGFTYQHLSQLAKQDRLSAQIIQDSIYAFAFDLKRNSKASKIKGSPLNYFMGILRNGQPYAFPANYESPQTEAMRLYVERKEAIRQKRQTLEARVAELAFNEWLEEEVTEEERRKIISPSIYCLQAKAPKRAELRDHFMKVVWPERRKATLEGINEEGVEGC